MQAGSEKTVGFMGLKSWLAGFLRRFFAAFGRRAANRPAAECVERSHSYHSLSRYIFQSGHFSRQKAKPGAFLPKPPELRISAVRIDRLSGSEVWEIGDLLASQSKPPRKPPIARANFDVAVLSEVDLTVEDDKEPHPRHINICGWPPEKDAQKAVALLLCSRASLNIR
jgi:hypothetical protein